MRSHFRDRHVEDTIFFEQEGRFPRCAECGMFAKAVGASHQATKMCKDATERRKKQTVAKRHEQMKKDLVFKVGGKPIEIVETFKHLGRVTAKNDNDEEAVKRNLGRARGKWASMRRFLIQDGVRPKTMAVFYRTVVLYVLLYGSESWVLTKDLMRHPRSFHRRCCQRTRERFHSTRRRRKLDLPEQ